MGQLIRKKTQLRGMFEECSEKTQTMRVFSGPSRAQSSRHDLSPLLEGSTGGFRSVLAAERCSVVSMLAALRSALVLGLGFSAPMMTLGIGHCVLILVLRRMWLAGEALDEGLDRLTSLLAEFQRDLLSSGLGMKVLP